VSELSVTDQIARHISKGRRKGDEDDGTPGVVNSIAFMPRPDWPPSMGLEEYLSVIRVDHFAGNLEQKLAAVTTVMKARLGGFDSERSRIGVLFVQAVHEAAMLKPKQLSVRIVNPEKDASYAGIFGMDLEDEIIAQELARLVLLFKPRNRSF
jgi:hypothetical protein